MLLSAVSVLVVAQSSSEIPEGLMNNPVYKTFILLCPPISHSQPASISTSRGNCRAQGDNKVNTLHNAQATQ